MKNIRDKRNWSQYNQKLKKIARIDFFISEEAIKNWYYSGKQRRGGKLIYSSHVIEICLLMREFYRLPYCQTEGFIQSVFALAKLELKTPDYTTISRRAANLDVVLRNRALIKKNKRKHSSSCRFNRPLSLYSYGVESQETSREPCAEV